MQTSQVGLSLIKKFEGLRLRAYQCSAGVWTIGYGHTSAAGVPHVREGMTITAEEAERILRADLHVFEDAVDDLVTAALTQSQFDALVSFAFNVGVGAFKQSTLLKRVNARRYADVPAELMKWTKAGGRELPGLVRRRRAEAALWRSVDEAAPVNPDESRAAPEPPKPRKSIVQSKEGNAAAIAGGAAAVTAAGEVVGYIGTLSEAIGRPAVLVLIGIALTCAAIWYWRRERLKEEGA